MLQILYNQIQNLRFNALDNNIITIIHGYNHRKLSGIIEERVRKTNFIEYIFLKKGLCCRILKL